MARVLITLSGLFLALRAVAAQQDQIPKELALALMPSGGTEGGEIIVGQMPLDVAAALTLPSSARVLGSFVSVSFAQVVIAFPGPTESAIAFTSRSLLAHGWTARQAATPRFGGLQYGPRATVPQIFCRQGSPESINVSGRFYGTGTTLLRLTRSTNSTVCDPSQPMLTTRASTGVSSGALERVDFVEMQRAMPLASVPPLWGPGDFRTSQVCQQRDGGMGAEQQEQPLKTNMSLTDVLAYYGRQLDSAGWKPAVAANTSVSGTWTDSLTKGDRHEVTITVTQIPSQAGCYQVSLRALIRSRGR